MGHILRLTDEEHEKYTTLKQNPPKPRLDPIRRHGQPRLNWIVEALKQVWEVCEEARKDLGEEGETWTSTTGAT